MILKILLKNGQELELNESFLTSIRYEDFVSNSEEIRIGVAPSAALDFTIINRDNVLSGKKFDGCEVVYYNDNDKKIGVFDCSEIKKNKKSIDFEMVDRMMRFEVDWKGCSFPTTTYNLLLNICGQCGISLRTEKKDIINGDLTIQDEDGLAGETCRTILKYLCEIFGSYANMDENGDLLIEYYDFNTIKDKIEYGQCTYFEIDEKISKRAGVLFKNDKENVQIGDTSSSYIIEDNPIIKQQSESVKKEVGQRIVDRIKYTSLKGGEFTLSKRDLKEGDVIEVVEENGDISVCVVSKIVFENLNKMTIYSYGDTKNTKESTSTSTSSRTTESETYSSEVYFGRGQNHQRVDIKGGTYVLCEKHIVNITTFSKVFLSLFVNFNYNQNKIIYFEIYANDKLAKRLKYEASVGFNQYSAGFLCDIDLEKDDNIFSCKVRLEDNEEIIIEPFECQLSFVVKSCKVEDAVANNSYFVEKVSPFYNELFNQKKLALYNYRDKMEVKMPLQVINVSADTNVDDVYLTLYGDYSMELTGTGNVKSYMKIHAMGEIAEQFKDYLINCKELYVGPGITRLGEAALKDSTNLERVVFENEIEIQSDVFNNCSSLKTIVFGGYTKIYNYGFKDCRSLLNIYNPEMVTYIGEYVFYNATCQSSIDFSNAELGYNAFECFTCPYVKISKDFNKIQKYIFNESNVDSCLVYRNNGADFFGDNPYCDIEITNQNGMVSTFIFDYEVIKISFPYASEEESKNRFITQFLNTKATNKTIYCNEILVSKIYEIVSQDVIEQYNCEIITYNTEEEFNNIISEVWDIQC